MPQSLRRLPARKQTPGQILADNARTCIQIAREVAPESKLYVWNDMFDPHHNAVPGPYYLVNGSLEKSWEGLDKNVIIVAWYFEKRAESLKFFADRGHPYIIAATTTRTRSRQLSGSRRRRESRDIRGSCTRPGGTIIGILRSFRRSSTGPTSRDAPSNEHAGCAGRVTWRCLDSDGQTGCTGKVRDRP